MVYLRNYSWQTKPQMQGLSVLWLDGIISMISLGTVLLIIAYFRLSWLTQLVYKNSVCLQAQSILYKALKHFTGKN